jgi:predicted cobalt transporter CbtA
MAATGMAADSCYSAVVWGGGGCTRVRHPRDIDLIPAAGAVPAAPPAVYQCWWLRTTTSTATRFPLTITFIFLQYNVAG